MDMNARDQAGGDPEAGGGGGGVDEETHGGGSLLHPILTRVPSGLWRATVELIMQNS